MNPYKAPISPYVVDVSASGSPKPAVVKWFNVYAGFLAVLYAGLAAVSLIAFPMWSSDLDSFVSKGGLLFGICGPLAVVFAAGIFLRGQPWHWVYCLVLICTGLSSPCLWPATIPLLIFWLKPEAKAYFGRS